MHLGRVGRWVAGLVPVAACARAGAPLAAQDPRVLPGIEILLRDSVHLVRDRTVVLVSNQAGIDVRGTSDVERLLGARIRLVALMSPEHGFRGRSAPGQPVASTTDSATGLPIYSLYGERRQPNDSMLAGVEAILVDLPDVGARYYTYLSTTIEVMRAAARLGRTVIVLDRPNPIGGTVQGNVLDSVYRSFVGPLAMPMRHGMTLGELALLANRELSIGAEVRVIPAAGWSRSMTLLETGLPFVPPSPNLRDLESLFHYPGTCLFEGTALSVGRGTDAPFHQIGAPWLDVPQVMALLERERLAGVRFDSVRFTATNPGDGKFAGVPVVGIRLVLTAPSRYDPTLAAVALLVAVHRVHPDRIGFREAHFDRLAGGPALRQALLTGMTASQITAGWSAPRAGWEQRRASVLLYP